MFEHQSRGCMLDSFSFLALIVTSSLDTPAPAPYSVKVTSILTHGDVSGNITMPDELWTPDIVVGIDFGMTCTAVAWSMGPQWTAPKTLQRWPGKLGHDLRNKVSTTVSYNTHSGELVNWGFLCDPDAEEEEFNELFKLYLDPKYAQHDDNAPDRDEAHKWFRDYLRCLREYIMGHLAESQPRLESKRLEFVFSVPTTWKDPGIIAAIEQSIKDAGYGVLNKERASVYMTEAEAAAVYASDHSMERNDIFLICDAGGGTTDVNVLKLASEPGVTTVMELSPLCWTEGSAAGSTLIDYTISQMLLKRLERVEDLKGDLEAVVMDMVGGDAFVRAKCSFGNEQFDVRQLSLPIPGLRPGVNVSDLGVQDSCMLLAIEELRAVFDQQVAKILALIDQQLSMAQTSFPIEQISYLVLSGGLGSSPYLRQKVRERYQDVSSRHSVVNAQRMKILLVDEPQLAVVHGLVIARTQECKGGPKIFPRRYCPTSYGIVCRQRYDSTKHRQEEVIEDPFDKTQWVEGQITWMIKQAELVDASNGARKSYRMRLPMGQEKQTWKASIVTSPLPSLELPHSLRESGSKPVCDLEFELHPRDLKRKNRHWYEFSTEYNRAEFEVRMLVGTGLRFEVWGKDGLRSRAHEEIAVDWGPGAS